jgi:uncharacterized membrane protein YidH (DUF202 family)
MTLENIGTIVMRALGVVMILFGTLSALAAVISYYEIIKDVALHDTLFVNFYSLRWSGTLVVVGILFLLLSKPLGRLLAKGLN